MLFYIRFDIRFEVEYFDLYSSLFCFVYYLTLVTEVCYLLWQWMNECIHVVALYSNIQSRNLICKASTCEDLPKLLSHESFILKCNPKVLISRDLMRAPRKIYKPPNNTLERGMDVVSKLLLMTSQKTWRTKPGARNLLQCSVLQWKRGSW